MTRKKNKKLNLLLVFFTQALSMASSSVFSYMVNLYVFEQTESVALFTTMSMMETIPALILGPCAGIIADLNDRRTIIQVTDIIASLSALLIVWQLTQQEEEGGEGSEGEGGGGGGMLCSAFFVSKFVGACAGEIQIPAFRASISQIVDEEDLDQFFSISEIVKGLIELLTPLIATLLLPSLPLSSFILLDVFLCLLASLSLFFLTFHPLPPSPEGVSLQSSSYFSMIVYGAHYITHNPLLLHHQLLSSLSSFTTLSIFVLLPPLLLEMGPSEYLGYVSSFAGCGVLVGSVLLSFIGAPKNKTSTISFLMTIQGITMIFALNSPTFALIGVVGFVYMTCEPFVGVCSSSIWSRMVPDDIQGRVFSFRDFLDELVQLGTLSLIGMTADFVEQQLKNESIIWATSWLCPGESPGVRLIFVLSGVFLAFFSFLSFLFGPREEPGWEKVEEMEKGKGEEKEKLE